MVENNEKMLPCLEKKRFGRRAFFGLLAIVLLTWGYHETLFLLKGDAELMKLGIDLFSVYGPIILGVVGFIFGGLTATDIFMKKKG